VGDDVGQQPLRAQGRPARALVAEGGDLRAQGLGVLPEQHHLVELPGLAVADHQVDGSLGGADAEDVGPQAAAVQEGVLGRPPLVLPGQGVVDPERPVAQCQPIAAVHRRRLLFDDPHGGRRTRRSPHCVGSGPDAAVSPRSGSRRRL
jgi:hypothetical protein